MSPDPCIVLCAALRDGPLLSHAAISVGQSPVLQQAHVRPGERPVGAEQLLLRPLMSLFELIERLLRLVQLSPRGRALATSLSLT